MSTSSVSFSDIGGYQTALIEVCELVFHLIHPESFTQLGVRPPQGFLLHGLAGCGKTLLAHAIAGVGIKELVQLNNYYVLEMFST